MSDDTLTRSPSDAGKSAVRRRVVHAMARLADDPAMTGRRSHRVSARLDPALIEAAKQRTGLTSETEVIEAALALIVEGDAFADWLVSQRGTLDRDFELPI
ncbi:MAG: hypothetical protein GVY28_14105 [Alphaproteobacteria bacterium]|jgi:hypothetical protein|nr:hypothetical protein [Alphaproteobacteria bacterium]